MKKSKKKILIATKSFMPFRQEQEATDNTLMVPTRTTVHKNSQFVWLKHSYLYICMCANMHIQAQLSPKVLKAERLKQLILGGATN